MKREIRASHNSSALSLLLLCILGCGAGSEGAVSNNIPNSSPIVDAGIDQTVGKPSNVKLLGTASDPDGSIASYQWSQTAGTNVVLLDSNAPEVSFDVPESALNEVLTFKLTVTDDQGKAAADSVDVTISSTNNSPTVDAGENQTVSPPTTVQLIGSANDSDGTITNYLWLQTAGTSVQLNNHESATANFELSADYNEETLSFSLTVTDNQGLTSTDYVEIIILKNSNQPPALSGSYPSAITVDQIYDFTPQSSDSENDVLVFSIQNKPLWADFDTTNGRLYGTPTSTNIGVSNNIVVGVTDGTSVVELPPFSISVTNQTDENCQDPKIHCVDVVAGEQQEFSSIQEAIDFSSSGDTIKVFSGTYSGFVFDKSGSVNAPIIVRAIGRVELAGSARGYSNIVRFQRANYVEIDGFTIIADGSANPYNYDYACIAARGASASSPMHGLTVKNTEISGCSPAGAYFSQTEGLTLDNNYIHDNVRDTQNGRGMGVYVSNASADNLVATNNRIIDNANAGIHMNGDSSVGGDGVQSGHLIENNQIIGNGQNGINMDGVQNSTFINNVFAENANHGMRDFRIDASEGPKNMIVVNNTYYSNGGSAVKFTSDEGGHTLFNNLVVSNGENVFNIGSSTSEVTNLFLTDSSVFLSVSQRDYRITSSNLAVNAGTLTFNSIEAPTTDLNENVRDNQPDVGAYESGSQ